MSKPGNLPIEHDVLQALIEKGFVSLDTRLGYKARSKLIRLSSSLPRNFEGSDFSEGQFGLGTGNPYNPDCDIHMYVRDGFSSLRLEGAYFLKHTPFLGFGNIPQGSVSRISHSTVYPKGIDGFGNLSNMVAMPFEVAAIQLSQQLGNIEKIGELCYRFCEKMGMTDLFSPSRRTGDFTFEVIHYDHNASVESNKVGDPTHVDPEDSAIVISISLGEHEDSWVIGRTMQDRELVVQKAGGLIVMDTDIDYGRQAPIHSPIVGSQGRDALVLILRNQARDIALRALPRLASASGWSPQLSSEVVPFLPGHIAGDSSQSAFVLNR